MACRKVIPFGIRKVKNTARMRSQKRTRLPIDLTARWKMLQESACSWSIKKANSIKWARTDDKCCLPRGKVVFKVVALVWKSVKGFVFKTQACSTSSHYNFDSLFG